MPALVVRFRWMFLLTCVGENEMEASVHNFLSGPLQRSREGPHEIVERIVERSVERIADSKDEKYHG